MGVGANPLGANHNPGNPAGRLAGGDRGLWLSMQAIRRQLAAMPHSLFLVRLIHQATRRPFPGERLWTATQLSTPATVRFLRIRNREGCDVYIWPYAEDQNAGYILVDLDRTAPNVLETMWANGHEPCVVLQTSPGHLQAWIHVSTLPLQPAVATAIGKHLARLYGGDSASTDWRHVGRLAGFTNQKPQRRTVRGHPPWVKIVHAHPGLARNADALLQSALHTPALASQGFDDAISERSWVSPQDGFLRLRPVSRRQRPCRSTKTGRADGASLSDSLHPTGASSICGSPGSCCRRVCSQSRSKTFFGWQAHIFRGATPTRVTTCAALLHTPVVFPRTPRRV